MIATLYMQRASASPGTVVSSLEGGRENYGEVRIQVPLSSSHKTRPFRGRRTQLSLGGHDQAGRKQPRRSLTNRRTKEWL